MGGRYDLFFVEVFQLELLNRTGAESEITKINFTKSSLTNRSTDIDLFYFSDEILQLIEHYRLEHSNFFVL